MASFWYLLITPCLYWMISVCFVSTVRVSAIQQYCVRNATSGNNTCTILNCTEPLPQLPKFIDLRKCPNTDINSPCYPDITTTEQPTTRSTESTVEQTSSPGTGLISTPMTVPSDTTHDTTLGNTQSTPLTTKVDSSTVTGERNYTTTSPPTPGESTTTSPPPVPPFPPLLIAVIVICCLVVIMLLVGIAYILIRKKNVGSCKVHCESEADSGSNGKDLSTLPAHGPSSTDQPNPSTPPPTGGQLIQTPHVADPIEDRSESRNRTFSTDSRDKDTSILMAEGKNTSQPETKTKKKEKEKEKEKEKNKNKKGSKDIELAPVQPKGASYEPANTNET